MNKGLRLLGLSSDYRTNKWGWTCPECKKYKELTTTMYSRDTAVCDRCGRQEELNYNLIEDKKR